MNRIRHIKDPKRFEKAAKVLKRARLILSAGFWGKDSYTLYKSFPNHSLTDGLAIYPRPRQPYAYCALGATYRANDIMQASTDAQTSALNALERVAWSNHSNSVTAINDRPDTNLEDILNLYDEAIEYVQQRADKEKTAA